MFSYLVEKSIAYSFFPFLFSSLGTLSIRVATANVTSRRTAPGQDALERFIEKTARSGLDLFPLTKDQNPQKFCFYLSSTLKIELLNKKPGSLKLKVHCRSLEILEWLWEDYCSGHLDTVADECLVTDELKRETGVDITWLDTTILNEDYLRCKAFLTGMSGRLSYPGYVPTSLRSSKPNKQTFKILFILMSWRYLLFLRLLKAKKVVARFGWMMFLLYRNERHAKLDNFLKVGHWGGENEIGYYVIQFPGPIVINLMLLMNACLSPEKKFCHTRKIILLLGPCVNPLFVAYIIHRKPVLYVQN